MKHNSASIESKVERVTYTSKRIYSLILQTLLLAGAVGAAIQILEINWKWLKVVEFCLLGTSVVLLAVSWMTPGVLVIFRVPWFAHAWFFGMNSVIHKKSWSNLSNIQKFFVYLWSLLLFSFVLLAIVGFTVQALGK